MHGYNILYGGDLNENDNFVLGKLIMRGYKKNMRAIFTTMKFLKQEKHLLYLSGLKD